MSDLINRRIFLTGAVATGMTAGSAVHAHQVKLPDKFLPQLVNTRTDVPAGEVHVYPDEFFLYLMLQNGLAIRYGVGVGRPGLYTPGTFTVARKAEWPWWRPTKAMIRREPGKYRRYAGGMPGGRKNPLGARALYLYDDEGRDTYLRVHGTNQPATIGSAVSNGCARLTNEHIKDLYDRVPVGTKVVLHPKTPAA